MASRPTPGREPATRSSTWVLRLLVGRLPRSCWWSGRRAGVQAAPSPAACRGCSDALHDPDVIHALQLTAEVAVIAVVINLVFGVGMSLLLVRYEFPGKRALSRAHRPAAGGLARRGRPGPGAGLQRPLGWFGPTLEDDGIQVIFATPGMIMATTFVALPLVIREVVPVLDGDRRRAGAGRATASAPTRCRRSGGSRCPASGGPSSTASC